MTLLSRVWLCLSLVLCVKGWTSLQIRSSKLLLAVATQKSFPAPLQRRLSLLEDHRYVPPTPLPYLDEEEEKKGKKGKKLPRRSATRTPRRRWKRLVLLAVTAALTASMLGIRSACAASSSTSMLTSSSPELFAQIPAVSPNPFIAVSAQAAGSSAAAAAASSSGHSLARELQLMFRLVYASVVGACLGKERSGSSSNRPAAAGVRTMSLVALGAATFTVCSAHGFSTGDPSRMAANVASGVGFVGAGVITTTTSSNGSNDTLVHGLTTAAAIWLSAAVGVASGVGLYGVSATGAALTIAILRLGRKAPTRPHRETTKKIKSKQQPRLVVPSSRVEAMALPKLQVQAEEQQVDNMTPLGDAAPLSLQENVTFLEAETLRETLSYEDQDLPVSPAHDVVDSHLVSKSTAGGRSSTAGSSLPISTSGKSSSDDITSSRSNHSISNSSHVWLDECDDSVIVHRHPLFIPQTLFQNVQEGLLRKSNDNFSP